MALTAQQNGMTTASPRAIDSPDCPRWAGRQTMLFIGAGLWVTLVCLCSLCGPNPLLWTLLGVIWAALALVCIRIQIYRMRSGETPRDEVEGSARMPPAKMKPRH
jgi:hypothetical protein